MAIIGVVHILNQFFAGIGGEEKANIAVGAVEGRSRLLFDSNRL
jgi:hypothetical protein